MQEGGGHQDTYDSLKEIQASAAEMGETTDANVQTDFLTKHPT